MLSTMILPFLREKLLEAVLGRMLVISYRSLHVHTNIKIALRVGLVSDASKVTWVEIKTIHLANLQKFINKDLTFTAHLPVSVLS